jgi:ribosomal protein L7/L12
MNPIPFNPESLTLAQAKHYAESLRTVFELIERNVEAEQIKTYLEQVRDQMLMRRY